MRTKTVRIVLDVTVKEASDDLLRELAADIGSKLGDVKGTILDETEPDEIADCVADAVTISGEIFAGSNIYLEVESTHVCSAGWAPNPTATP